MPGQTHECVVCKQPAKHVCAFCGESGGVAHFCADHRCVHFADQIAKEYEKANPKPNNSAQLAKGAFAVIGVIVALAWINSGGDAWDRIMVVMAVSVIALTVYACTKSSKR